MNSRILLTKTLLTLLMTVYGFSATHSQIQKGHDLDGEGADDRSGWAVSMPNAHTVAIGAYLNDGSASNAGHVRIYEWNGTAWVQKGIDIDGEAATDESGWSVSMPDANTVAVGARYNDGSGPVAGHVRIYEWNGTAWVQKGVDIDGEAAGDWSGYSVSMPDANTVAIGAVYNDGSASDAGHVRIYEWNGTAWVQKGIDIDGEAADDRMGNSVSMPDANTVAIGAFINDGNGNSSGHVRVYEWNGTVWAQKGIDIDGEAADDESGYSVSMPDANTVAVGARYNDGSGPTAGHVRIYEWNGTAWLQKGIDIDGEAAGDRSGWAVSMPDANTVAIGARNNADAGILAGHVRIYEWNGTAWVQKGIDIDGEAAQDFSGAMVSMPNAYTVAIGAYANDGNGVDAGHVRIYKLKGVQGVVYNDVNQNCIQEELGIVEGVLGIIQPGNIIVESGSNGMWLSDSLPIGNYTITFDTTSNWLATCPNPLSFSVTDPNGITIVPSFGMVNTNPCPEPNVSIHMPFIRPGFSSQKIYAEACNDITATGAINNAVVVVSLNDSITVDNASMSYINLGNNTFSINVGTLNPGECVSFNLSTTVSSTAILGQTLCMEAELLPLDSCALDSFPAPSPPDFIPCNLPWDNSSILVEGECINDSIVFTITNTGDPGGGDMDCYSPVRLYIDGTYIWLDSVQLNGGDSFTYNFAGDGQTWHLEVDQHPLHPGNSNPNATIELCGNEVNWTPDLVNIFPHDDLNPINDIYCGVVTGSYDPNDKTGYPLGVGNDHLIEPNGKLDYVIRFQNTGNDTAFTVVIRDTLDTNLDIFSVQSGVASHPYSFQMYGPRVLEWTFDNILLPDSTTNEPESNGFVTFTVNQVSNLPDSTEINNTADIYFDYNLPIITNTTSHLIGSGLATQSWTEEMSLTDTACNQYIYNGTTYTQTGNYYQVKPGFSTDTLVNMNLTIYNTTYGTDIQTACDSLIWIDGVTYTTSNNTATHILTNSVGCDSIVSLDLSINGSDEIDVQTACDSFTWIDSLTYTSSNNTATYTYTNTMGCDSVIHLDLTINTVSDLTTSLSGITITSNNSNASYIWLDCDSNFVPISGETNQSFTPNQNGSYAVELTENGCIDTSACVAVTTIGILENNFTDDFVLFPNPTRGELKIIFESEQQDLSVTIFTISGELVQQKTVENASEVIVDIEGASGTYLLKLQSNGQEAIIRVVKE